METPEHYHTDGPHEYELSELRLEDNSTKGTPVMLSNRSSRAALHAEDPQEGATVQELPPIDGGIKAWTFCFSAFMLEMMVWGFAFR